MARIHPLASVCLAGLFCGACATTLQTSQLPLSECFEVPVTIAGQESRFVLDTGCGQSVVAAATKDRLGLTTTVAETATAAWDATGAVRQVRELARVEGLVIGAIPFDPCNMVLLPLGDWFPSDGILGLDAMLGLAWVFDPAAGQVVATGKEQLDDELLARGLLVKQRVPLRLDRQRNQIWVHIRCNGKLVELQIDTGATQTSLPRATIEELKLPDGEHLRQRDRQRAAERIRRQIKSLGGVQVKVTIHDSPPQFIGVHGETRSYVPYRLERLDLGEEVFSELCVSASVDVSEQERGDTGQVVNGRLGQDVLGGLIWALDWRHNELLILTR